MLNLCDDVGGRSVISISDSVHTDYGNSGKPASVLTLYRDETRLNSLNALPPN
jgi:hypothetical protein